MRDWRTAIHPHTRGDYGFLLGHHIQPHRSIPTRVGTTPVNPSGKLLCTGPSPHAWGLLAGNGAGLGHRPVHPHTRGDYG